MKLFFYYVSHSVKNQLRKLFKSWVLALIVVCALLGAAIGFGASKLGELADNKPAQTEADPADPGGTEGGPENPGGELPDDGPDKAAAMQGVELLAGAVILAVLLVGAYGADKNGSRIFLPADVPLLFAAPMRPQSVLMFRLATQMGAVIFGSVYLLFQLPTLMVRLGLGAWGAAGILAAWYLTIVTGRMLQVLLYTICSTRPGAKAYIRRGIYVLLVLVAAGYAVYWRSSGQEPLAAALQFFNAPASRYIPVWGWLKGIVMFVAEGAAVRALLCLAASVLAIGVLLVLIRRQKADFYEDAMAKSEEVAELLDQAQSRQSGVALIKRKKDRADKLRRDGLRRGFGASVFFHKALYNRFRFAHLGYFTKTAETYLVTAVGVALLCMLVIKTTVFMPVALVLAFFAFYRTLGNPLEEDTRMDYFRMVPESPWAKLFYSLMGGTVNCLLDLLPGVLVAALILRAEPLEVLAWLVFIVSVDFYGTCVGTFIDLSTPAGAAGGVKSLVQLLFLYFGLLPPAAIIAVALAIGHAAAGMVGGAASNVLLGLVFFLLTPLFLTPRAGGRGVEIAALEEADRRTARSCFSRMGLSALLMLVLTTVAQIVLAAVLNRILPGWSDWPYSSWLVNFGPLYLVGVPLGLLAMRRVPATLPSEQEKMTVGRYLSLVFICVFMMQAGNWVGITIQSLVERVVGSMPANPLETFAAADNSLPMRILFIVILAPLIEEFIFRRFLIDRMRPYGEKLAVVTSALMFGLFHGNLSQMFYAFTLGLVLGYVYLRTGKLRHSVGLHMIVNFFGGVVSVELTRWAASGLKELESLTPDGVEDLMNSGAVPDLSGILTPGLVALLAYSMILLCCAVVGLVALCIRSRKVYFRPAPLELPRGQRFSTVWLNVGMLLFVAICLTSVVLTYME